jgi:hypothetical protein
MLHIVVCNLELNTNLNFAAYLAHSSYLVHHSSSKDFGYNKLFRSDVSKVERTYRIDTLNKNSMEQTPSSVPRSSMIRCCVGLACSEIRIATGGQRCDGR